MTSAVSITIAGKLDSKSNARPGHWSQRHKKSRSQREHAAYATLQAFRTTLRVDPSIWFFDAGRDVVVVRLVRCSPRRLDDDNLRDAFKSVRDGIRRPVRRGRQPRLAFEYAQESYKDARGSHVRIEIRDKEQG